METSVNGNAVTFKTSHFSKFVIAEEMESNTSVKPDTNTKNKKEKLIEKQIIIQIRKQRIQTIIRMIKLKIARQSYQIQEL